MNVRELAVLEALNTASTIYARRIPRFRYEATAAQITHEFNTDQRFQSNYRFTLTVPQVAAILTGLVNRPYNRSALVEVLEVSHGRTKWCLTREGCQVLLA